MVFFVNNKKMMMRCYLIDSNFHIKANTNQIQKIIDLKMNIDAKK